MSLKKDHQGSADLNSKAPSTKEINSMNSMFWKYKQLASKMNHLMMSFKPLLLLIKLIYK